MRKKDNPSPIKIHNVEYVPVTAVEALTGIKESVFRQLLMKRQSNGLSLAYRKIGMRVLLNKDILLDWAEKYKTTVDNVKVLPQGDFTWYTIQELAKMVGMSNQAMYLIVSRKKDNGLDQAVKKHGRNLMIRSDLFEGWLEGQSA